MSSPDGKPHCSTPPQPPLDLPASMPLGRQRALMVGAPKWANGTVLHYGFFGADTSPDWAPPNAAQADVVRESFKTWKSLGLGLDFREVDDLAEAEVRIGFLDGDGSWSYVGRDVLKQPVTERTMSFGWDLTTQWGGVTAIHEIGHTLGMPHEHQSPFSGIVWNEEAVYASFGAPPNSWPHDQVLSNVIRKLSPAQVEGSEWDPESVMEYPFEAGLIEAPDAHKGGIAAPDGISELDVKWMKTWYPGDQPTPEKLIPFKSVQLDLEPKQQADFAIAPPASRDYEIATFGSADTVLVLFEEVEGDLRYVAGDDDGGEDRNAHLKLKLFQGRNYVVRVRLYWAGQSGQTALMYW
jgi:Astacin (Peptidase family M12A)